MGSDEQVDRVLRQSRGVEPSPGFEDAVWRRIRAERGSPVVRTAFGVVPVAVAAGCLVGLGLGLMLPVSRHQAPSHSILAREGSLTGAYIAMASGGQHE